MTDDNGNKLASLAEVRDYFGLSAKQMMSDWRKLTEDDKRQLRAGLGDGTLTY